jgi:hypothetical protein
MGEWRVPGRCGLCGQHALGFAFVLEDGKDIRLCHDPRRDCYRDWTLCGMRPHRSGLQMFQAWLKWIQHATDGVKR